MNRRNFNKLLTTSPLLFSHTLRANHSILHVNRSPTNPFRLFNQLHFKNMPNLNDDGLSPISFVYAGQMWPDKIAKNDLNIDFIVNKYKRKKLLGNDKLLILDIENWPVRRVSDEVFNKSVENYNKVISIFRELYPGVKIGLFEYAPLSYYPLYDQIVANSNPEQRLYSKWREEIKRVKIITDQVDVIVPQLYSRWPNDNKGWQDCAREVMLRARQIANGRPVIPVLWPQYWLRDKSAPIINGEHWATILKTMYELADSVVLWSISLTATEWDANAEWWLETQKFIADPENYKNNACV